MKHGQSAIALFNKPELKKFVDRDEIRKITADVCNNMLKKPDEYFKVIDIYGIGGIGKSCLLSELKNEIIQKISCVPNRLIFVSFEINKQQMLHNLVKIRRSFNESCTVFDYALLNYWDKSGCIEKLDDEFMYKIRGNFLGGIIDTVADFGSVMMPDFPTVPSANSIFECVGKLIQTAQKIPMCNYLKCISQLDTQELLAQMPRYLGFDIDRIINKTSDVLVFLCDSYQQSVPYSESKEWLMELICQIHRGTFIITGREKLKWDDPQKDIIPYHLQCFSEDIARQHLKDYIPNANDNIINDILLGSQCLPLFVDMAIDVYQQEKNDSKLCDLSFFKDRYQLMQRFLFHLLEKWQSMLLILAVIGVFDRDIFLSLGKNMNCSCPMEDYEEIINSSLLNYTECTDGLTKLHDVFCSHAIKVLSYDFKKQVWHYYLENIVYRGVWNNGNTFQGMLVALFQNLLHRCNKLQLELTIQETEWIFDIFFQIMETRTFFEPPIIGSGSSEEINDIIFVFNAVVYEKKNTCDTIKLLKSVKNPSKFGKHEKSYNLLLLYSECIAGNYSEFYTALIEMERQLKNSEMSNWYYFRIKIYISDFLMMKGQFHHSLQKLLSVKNIDLSDDMVFQLERVIGHIYRFNMELDMAERTYLINNTRLNNSINSRVYLQTNLCETYCFFQPEKFKYLYKPTLDDALSLGNLKNIGKLYYSNAIVLIQERKYSQAYSMIQNSLEVNKHDGYQSGELFAYMAQAYCDYAIYGKINSQTYNEIQKLLVSNKVYDFFELPIIMMSGKNTSIEPLRHKYEWLNFDYTVNQYKNFLEKLHPNDLSE